MKKNLDVKRLVVMSILLAITVLLQAFSSFFKLGVFSITLSLLPIIVGAILFGPKSGALLGFVFSLTVILSGDAAFFMGFGVFQTLLIVLLKGTLAGFCCGCIYNVFKKHSVILAFVIASMTAPLVNTSIFIIGVLTILRPALYEAAGASGADALKYMFVGFIGFNFILEFAYCAVLSPVVARICHIGAKIFNIKIN